SEDRTEYGPAHSRDPSYHTSTPKRRPVPPPHFDPWSLVDPRATTQFRDQPLRLKCDLLTRSEERSQSMSPISHSNVLRSDDSWLRDTKTLPGKRDQEPLYCD
ncbi:unnamed protein product, partial [Lymnaea stagnalis]